LLILRNSTGSAFGMVGLITGIAALLTSFGKLVIILFMFIGRVALLMLSVYLAHPTFPWHVRVLSEDVGSG
jgi:Trk-type K+ transport system membrane component